MRLKCAVVWSEDLGDGQIYGGRSRTQSVQCSCDIASGGDKDDKQTAPGFSWGRLSLLSRYTVAYAWVRWARALSRAWSISSKHLGRIAYALEHKLVPAADAVWHCTSP